MPNENEELHRNSQGGINDRNKAALERAQSVDLITLPKNISGTNCFNCKWIREKKSDKGYCYNKRVKQYVNGRMCCVLWSNQGEYRPFKRKGDFS